MNKFEEQNDLLIRAGFVRLSHPRALYIYRNKKIDLEIIIELYDGCSFDIFKSGLVRPYISLEKLLSLLPKESALEFYFGLDLFDEKYNLKSVKYE